MTPDTRGSKLSSVLMGCKSTSQARIRSVQIEAAEGYRSHAYQSW